MQEGDFKITVPIQDGALASNSVTVVEVVPLSSTPEVNVQVQLPPLIQGVPPWLLNLISVDLLQQS